VTPEEKAVIDAAIDAHAGWRGGNTVQEVILRQAVHTLISSCPKCNSGGHTCPGCGESIGHTETACLNCEPLVAGVSATWVDGTTFEEAPRAPQCQCSRTEKVYCVLRDCHGGADVPAITIPWSQTGPELNLTAASHPCIECMAEPMEDPRVWCDCGGNRDVSPCPPPCVQRAHAVLDCPNAPAAQWVPTTLLYALAGDRLRIGQDETDVLRSSSGAWHANVVSSVLPSGKTWDKIHPWEHRELRLELSANPGFQQYPEDLACEILMSAERRAVHLLMSAFPGSTVLDSPQAEK
jgi:hypothetical protein